MKSVVFFLSFILFTASAFSTGWRFIGPDSTNWRIIVQMDVSFDSGRPPYVGVGTSRGVCMMSNNTWRYTLPDRYDPSFHTWHDYRSVYFAPWNDSTGFVGSNVTVVSEPGSKGGTVSNIHAPFWAVAPEFGGGYIGNSPSIAFEFSPHRPNHVYAWIIDLYRSTNCGGWWEPLFLDSYGAFFLSLDRARDSLLYAGRVIFGQQQAGIYRSTDDGVSWTFVRPLAITSMYPYQRSAELHANGDTLILAVNRFPLAADTTCGISVSTDYGVSWSNVLPGINVQKITSDALQPNIMFAAVQGGIYRSVNGGLAWQLYANGLPSPNLVDIRKDPYSDTLYVATSDSGVYAVFDPTVGVPDIPHLPAAHGLYQNYPNPFNPETRIEFVLESAAFVSLKVYDLLAREVANLVNEPRSAGRHAVTFRAADMPSGVYFCRLTTGTYAGTRKMVLMK